MPPKSYDDCRFIAAKLKNLPCHFEGDANFEKPKPGRKRSSPVWDYFTSVEKDLTSCNMCGATVRCPKSGTSTMIHHLQSAHPGEYGEMLLKTSQKVSLRV